MADRYWRGGTGTWDATTTTNWSATSGGAGGASAPTTADNVFFNSASNATAYTVTVTGTASCADLTMAGPASGNVTWAGTGTLNINGSMTLSATGITRSYTGTITFSSTATGRTITTNGVDLGSGITFNSVGGGWTLGSALTTSATLTMTAGTFNTSAASSYAVTCSRIVATSSTTAVINFNASTVTVTGGSGAAFSGTGLTFNAGTSQINFSSTTGTVLTTNNRTFYNVAFTGAFITSANVTISGANTFNNLTFTAPSSTVICTIFIPTGLVTTVNGTLTGSGATEVRRMLYRSGVTGTTATLALANPTTISNADFMDVTASTSAITATSGGGNRTNNTNITFPAPKTVYWNLAGAQNWSAIGWATSPTGTPSLANFPLAQDTATFTNSGSVTGTITVDQLWSIGTMDMSGRTSAMTLATGTFNVFVFGSWFNGPGVTLSGTTGLTFYGRGSTQQINGSGVSFTQPIVANNADGTLQLTGAVTLGSTLAFNLTNGTLDLQSYTLTTGQFNSNNSNTRTIAFGTGNITVNGSGTVWITALVTGLTTTGSRIVNVSNNTAVATTVSSGSPPEASLLSFNFTTGAYALTLAGDKGSMNFTGFAGSVTNASQFIFGDLNLGSTATFTAGASAWTFASTSGTPRTITSNGKTMDFPLTFSGVGGTWVLQDALTMGSTRTLTHTNGTIDLNGKTLTVGSSYTVAAGTKNLTFNGGTLICPSSFSNGNPTNYTTTAGTGVGTISMTSASSKNFVGGGSTYNCTLNQGGAGSLVITGANTFNNITNTVQPATVEFPISTTTTFNNFNLNGTPGNLITITSPIAHTLSKASGTVSCDYLSITRSNATGGAAWYAGANSTNVTGNTGWIFTAPPAPSGNTGAFFSIL